MDNNSNALNWFEIATLDLPSSVQFYEQVFATKMGTVTEMGGFLMSFFPSGEGKVGGALIQGENHKPSMEGSLIYLNANPSIAAVADRIGPAGGKLLMPPTQISPEIGYMIIFADNQGNCVAAHANKL